MAERAAASNARGLSLPTTKEVTDSLALSFSQATAPYVLGGAVFFAGLAALRELARPLEAAVRNTLAVGLLILVVGALVDNWDQLYGAYEVISGAKPLRLF